MAEYAIIFNAHSWNFLISNSKEKNIMPMPILIQI